MSSTLQDMDDLQKEAKVFMFVTGPLTKVVRAIFASIYYHEDLNSKLQSPRPAIMFENKRKVKDCFGSNMTKTVAKDKSLKADYDLKFYIKAITTFWKHVYENELYFSPETKKLLDKAQSSRNNLAHNGVKYTESTEQLMNYFTDMCNKLMDNVKQDLRGHEIDKVRRKIENLMKEIRDTDCNINQYQEKQRVFFTDQKNRFIRDSQVQLGDRNEFGTAIDPFVKLVRQRGLCAETDHPIVDVFVSPRLFCGEFQVKFHDILLASNNGEKLPKIILVSGHGGSGKSTLCHIIFNQWRQKSVSKTSTINCLDSFDLVVYIELKFTESEKLEDFLRDQYLIEQFRHIPRDDFPQLFDDLKVLFIVDGYDEKKGNGDKLIRNIELSSPKSWIIITTRPEYAEDCEAAFRSAPCVTWVLQGFEDEERSKFVGKVFKLVVNDDSIRKTQLKKFHSYLETRASSLANQLQLPLTMALLTFLWLENRGNSEVMDSINTATKLYFQVFKMLREKLIKIRSNLKSENVHVDNIDEVIALLQQKAFDQLKTDLLSLTEENRAEIEKECGTDINSNEVLSAFLTSDAKRPVSGKHPRSNSTLYSFFHRSQMEYYSANFISCSLDDGSRNLGDYLHLSDKRKYKAILPFLAGCLKMSGQLNERYYSALLDLANAVVGETDFQFWFTLLHETESSNEIENANPYDEAMTRTMTSYLPRRTWTLKGVNVKTIISALKLLTYCREIEIDELTIHFSNNDDLKNSKGLRPTLEAIEHSRKRLTTKRKTNLFLYFAGYQQNDINYLSDPLKYFGSWCNVVEYTGRIQKVSVQHLALCRHIEVKVNKLAMFNEVVKLSNLTVSQKSLKRMKITIAFPKDETKTESPERTTLCSSGRKIDLNFQKLIESSVEKTVKFIKDTCPDSVSGSLYYVTMEGNVSYEDGLQVVSGLQGVVNHKVCINSKHDLTTQEETRLVSELRQRSSSFVLVWNNWDIR